FISFQFTVHSRLLHSFPTRRSSDLFPYSLRRVRSNSNSAKEMLSEVDSNTAFGSFLNFLSRILGLFVVTDANLSATLYSTVIRRDRKSTRLNSSHVKISYAVFCLKK